MRLRAALSVSEVATDGGTARKPLCNEKKPLITNRNTALDHGGREVDTAQELLTATEQKREQEQRNGKNPVLEAIDYRNTDAERGLLSR